MSVLRIARIRIEARCLEGKGVQVKTVTEGPYFGEIKLNIDCSLVLGSSNRREYLSFRYLGGVFCVVR